MMAGETARLAPHEDSPSPGARAANQPAVPSYQVGGIVDEAVDAGPSQVAPGVEHQVSLFSRIFRSFTPAGRRQNAFRVRP